MKLFNTTGITRACRCLETARRNLIEVQNHCSLAKANLEDSGRDTQAMAVEMMCESARQLERDVVRWTELIQKTRENGHG